MAEEIHGITHAENSTEYVSPEALGGEAPSLSGIYTTRDINPGELPARNWVFGALVLSGYISACIAPGGTGKSMFSLVCAISVALGKPLLKGFRVPKQLNVLILNNEDDKTELDRRISAICQHYKIDLEELDNKLFIRSGYESPVKVASYTRTGTVNPTADRDNIVQFCKYCDIGFIVVDPYVSFHEVPENVNELQNEVISIWRFICSRACVALLLVTHTRKAGENSESHAGDSDALRGASSIRDGARIAFTLAKMSRKTARDNRIDWREASSLVRLDDAKMNFTKKAEQANWFSLHSVKLANGDMIGVPVSSDVARLLNAPDTAGMTGTAWAEIIEQNISDEIKNKGSFYYKDIKEKLTRKTEYGKSSVAKFVSFISQDENNPTNISVDGRDIDYHVEKGKNRNSPWTIYRRETPF